MDCSLPDSSIHGISQARILEQVPISSPRGIFPTQGSNPCLLHWQVDPLLLRHLGSPEDQGDTSISQQMPAGQMVTWVITVPFPTSILTTMQSPSLTKIRCNLDEQKGLATLTQLGIALKGHFGSRAPGWVSQGSGCFCISASFAFLPFPSIGGRSQGHPLKSILHPKLHGRVCLQGKLTFDGYKRCILGQRLPNIKLIQTVKF